VGLFQFHLLLCYRAHSGLIHILFISGLRLKEQDYLICSQGRRQDIHILFEFSAHKFSFVISF
jgi:hypothetical protein